MILSYSTVPWLASTQPLINLFYSLVRRKLNIVTQFLYLLRLNVLLCRKSKFGSGLGKFICPLCYTVFRLNQTYGQHIMEKDCKVRMGVYEYSNCTNLSIKLHPQKTLDIYILIMQFFILRQINFRKLWEIISNKQLDNK